MGNAGIQIVSGFCIGIGLVIAVFVMKTLFGVGLLG